MLDAESCLNSIFCHMPLFLSSKDVRILGITEVMEAATGIASNCFPFSVNFISSSCLTHWRREGIKRGMMRADM